MWNCFAHTISQVNNKIKAALHFYLIIVLLLPQVARLCSCALKYCSTFASDGWLPTLLERWLWMLIDLTPSSCLDEFLLSTLKVLIFGSFTHKRTITFLVGHSFSIKVENHRHNIEWKKNSQSYNFLHCFYNIYSTIL